jgi:hypothetical protein
MKLPVKCFAPVHKREVLMDEGRFDWRAIARVSGIIIGVTAIFGLVVPVAGAFIDGNGPLDTRTISGHQIYLWLFWAIAWGLTIWQAGWMLREVGERIVDDMLVTSIIVAITLMILRVIVWLAYEPVSGGVLQPPITGIDAAGGLMLIVIALVGARMNRY